MTFRPAGRVREPAVPMQPLVDPAGWYPDDLAANDDWIYELSETEAAEVRDAVAGVERRRLDIKDIRRENFPLPTFDDGLAADGIKLEIDFEKACTKIVMDSFVEAV